MWVVTDISRWDVHISCLVFFICRFWLLLTENPGSTIMYNLMYTCILSLVTLTLIFRFIKYHMYLVYNVTGGVVNSLSTRHCTSPNTKCIIWNEMYMVISLSAGVKYIDCMIWLLRDQQQYRLEHNACLSQSVMLTQYKSRKLKKGRPTLLCYKFHVYFLAFHPGWFKKTI